MHRMKQNLSYQSLSLILLLCFHDAASAFIHEWHLKSHRYPEIKDTLIPNYGVRCIHLQRETSNKQSQAELSVFEKHEYSYKFQTVQPNEAQNNYGMKYNVDLLCPNKEKMYNEKKIHDFASKNSNIVIYSDRNKLTLLQDSSVEILVDFAIDMLNQEIKREGNNKIKIPDINETFFEQVGPVKIRGGFNARNGWFYSLSSLYRTDEIHISRGGNVLTVLVGVGLKEMIIDYNEYKLKFMNVGPRGKIEAQVANNSIEMILTVDITDSRCKIKLTDIKITKFSGLKIHITGVGRLNFFVSKVANWVVDIFYEEIKEKAEGILANALEGVLDKIKC